MDQINLLPSAHKNSVPYFTSDKDLITSFPNPTFHLLPSVTTNET